MNVKDQLKSQVNKGNVLIETTFLTCMTIGVATSFGNGYSHMLKSVFEQKTDDPLNEF